MSDFLHFVRPNFTTSLNASVTPAPVVVNVDTPAMFELLEINLRSEIDEQKYIGTLLGSRSDDGSSVTVKGCYIVPHNESGDDVTIEEQHNRNLYQQHRKANPKDVIVGWFCTSTEIDPVTSVIHDYYTKNYFQEGGIYLTLQHRNSQGDVVLPELKTYVAATVGISAVTAKSIALEKNSSYLFAPVPNKTKFSLVESSVLCVIAKSAESKNTSETGEFINALEGVESLIDSIVAYIDGVLDGSVVGNVAVGKQLLDSLLVQVDSLRELENSFAKSSQNGLMLEFIAATLKSQLDATRKLADA